MGKMAMRSKYHKSSSPIGRLFNFTFLEGGLKERGLIREGGLINNSR